MKINNKIIGLSLVMATSLLSGCVKDNLFDMPMKYENRSNFRNIYSNITEVEVIPSKESTPEDFDKTIATTLNGQKNLSANDLGQLFSTVGQTTVLSNVTILSMNDQTYEYTKPIVGYPIIKTLNGEQKEPVDKNVYSTNIKLQTYGDNQFKIHSILTKKNFLQTRNFEYQGTINQNETYPIYVSQEDNHAYKIVFIQVQKVKEKKK